MPFEPPKWGALNQYMPGEVLDLETPTANSKQISGDHYQIPIQPWDYIIQNDLGYLEGNIIKYVTRWKKKNGKDDLLKALHYLEKLIEVASAPGNDREGDGEKPE